ncbi:glycoside hydrolase family 28 protein [Actinomycetospora chiangmaiensis]|uniref:glycoside hydrolase family 28 protein n=1 Tax=Actinomycetospora chiangmaiensis TaxID=402650 RepID=UPI0003792316|nr:glycoside hydrolase family 28 protein [Actinomycetospora chiangmaiensis]
MPLRRRRFLASVLPGLGLAATTALTTADAAPRPAVGNGPLDVRAFGARGDGTTRDTAAIQAAVDAAAARGGGTVLLPAGTFLSGTVELRSDVTLHLSPGATLLGSPDIADYPAHDLGVRDLDIGGRRVWALLYARDAERVTIEGAGTIDGSGRAFPKVLTPDPEIATGPRPRMVFLRGCRSVALRDVTLREAGMWTVHLAQCEDVQVRGLTVLSSQHVHQDGIVVDSCARAVVSDCRVDTLDDAVVLKSSYPQPCRDVLVTGCTLSSRCAGLKLGTQSLGGFRRIRLERCVLHECRLGGLKLQTVDGGDLEDVVATDLVMHDVAAPLAVRRGNRGFDYGLADVVRPRPVGALRAVQVRRLRATVSRAVGPPSGDVMSIAGLPGFPVEDVILEDLQVTTPGGGTPADARRTGIPEVAAAYPEHTMFGVLPAHGLWMRHASGITVRDLRVETVAPDARPAVVADDVANLDLR